MNGEDATSVRARSSAARYPNLSGRTTNWIVKGGVVFAWVTFGGIAGLLYLRGHYGSAIASLVTAPVVSVMLFYMIYIVNPWVREFEVNQDGLTLQFHHWHRPNKVTVPWKDVTNCRGGIPPRTYGLFYDTDVVSYFGYRGRGFGSLTFEEGACRAILPYLPASCKRSGSIERLAVPASGLSESRRTSSVSVQKPTAQKSSLALTAVILLITVTLFFTVFSFTALYPFLRGRVIFLGLGVLAGATAVITIVSADRNKTVSAYWGPMAICLVLVAFNILFWVF